MSIDGNLNVALFTIEVRKVITNGMDDMDGTDSTDSTDSMCSTGSTGSPESNSPERTRKLGVRAFALICVVPAHVPSP